MLSRLLLCLLISFFSLSSFATIVPANLGEGGSDRGGGDGMYINGQLYLLDLVELGIETVVAPTGSNHPVINTALAPAVTDLKMKPNTARILNTLLYNYGQVDIAHHTFMLAGLLTISNLNWVLTSTELKNVEDEDTEILCQDQCVQLAVRRDQTVYVSKKYFEQLNATNQAALIFHEILYYFLDKGTLNTSREIRQIVGYFFKGPEAYGDFWRGGTVKSLYNNVFGENFRLNLNVISGTDLGHSRFYSFGSPLVSLKYEDQYGPQYLEVRFSEVDKVAHLDYFLCHLAKTKKVSALVFHQELSFGSKGLDAGWLTVNDRSQPQTFELSKGGTCLQDLATPIYNLVQDFFSRYKPF